MDDNILNKLVFEAEKHFKVADHMAYISYPLVKEVKLLMNITENLNNSLKKTIQAILYYERTYKRISFYPSEYENQIDFFRRNVSRRYSIKSEDVQFLLELNKIVNEHKRSSIEFIRKNKYVIANDRYRLRILTIEDVKKYISKAKLFILLLRKIV